MSASKKRGRPPKRELGVRVPLGLRVTTPLKQRLDAAAARSGRSQSQEAEFRLEGSFADEGLFSSPETKFWAVYFADTFHEHGAARAIELDLDDKTDSAWRQNPDCFRTASFAVMEHLYREMLLQPHQSGEAMAAFLDDMEARIQSLKSRIVSRALNQRKAKP